MTRRPPRAGERDPLLASIATLAERLARAERRLDAYAGDRLRIEALEHRNRYLERRLDVLERELRALRGSAPSRPEPTVARLVTVEAAATMLDASTKHVRRLAGEGELEIVDVRTPDAPGPAWRVNVTSLEELLARRRALGSARVHHRGRNPGPSRADARKE